MAIAPTPPPPGKPNAARKANPKTAKRATKAATKPVAKAATPRKASVNAKAARARAPKSTAETLRETVSDRIVKPARAAAESAAQNARGAAQAARESIGAAANQSSAFGLKMIEHAEQNAREAFNAMRAAAKSKDVSEVLKVQGDYLREQGSRSLTQAREVADLIAQFGRDAIAPLTGRKK